MGWVWLGISLAAVRGKSTGTPTVIIGAATMKMISSTSITSTIGVMLISLITAFLRPRRPRPPPPPRPVAAPIPISVAPRFELSAENGGEFVGKAFQAPHHLRGVRAELVIGRSEERRVGKEGGSAVTPRHGG